MKNEEERRNGRIFYRYRHEIPSQDRCTCFLPTHADYFTVNEKPEKIILAFSGGF